MRRKFGLATLSLLVWGTSGCATIFSGTQQKLQVKPAGAQVDVYSWDGKLVASSKTDSDSTVTAHRPDKGQSYLVRVQKDGYCPGYWLTTPTQKSVTS
jgi:hypothetical protein